VGVALDPPTKPSLFVAASIGSDIIDNRFDIRNSDQLRRLVSEVQPDCVFHLAAQALVKKSYLDPADTWSTNVMGTLNVLDAVRTLRKKCSVVLITSDKCYENLEWVWGYRESDRLGGIDPYSASKAAAELAIRSYVRSFLGKDSYVRVASARAGNVIGGGDWSPDRIVPDCIRAWRQNSPVELRYPEATRPWQHALEPISGYLSLAVALESNPTLHGEAFNFGPPAGHDHSVLQLVTELSYQCESLEWHDVSKSSLDLHESTLLRLNCDKVLHFLDWQASMDFEQTIKMTAAWYRTYYEESDSIPLFTRSQIEEYSHIACAKGISWAT